MLTKFKRLTALGMAGVLTASPLLMQPLSVFAADTSVQTDAEQNNVSLNVTNNQNVDVVLTKGNTTMNLTNFKADLLSALSKQGINTSKVNISAIETAQTDMQNSFSWNRDVSSSIGSISTSSNSVSMAGNSSLAGKNCLYAFPTQNGNNYDFTLGYRISFGDSFNAAGMLLKVEKDGNYLTGYMLSFNNRGTFSNVSGSTGAIWKFKWQIGTNTSNMVCTTGTTPGVNQCVLVRTLPINTSGNLHVVVNKNEIKVSGGGLSEVKITTDSAYSGTGFGFFSDHYSHGCDNIGSFSLTTLGLEISSTKQYSDVLKAPEWRKDAKHIVVNASDEVENDFKQSATMASVLSKTINDNVHYIAWGNPTNKDINNNFIVQNHGNGVSFYSSSTSRYTDYVNETAAYIKNMLNSESSSDYVISDVPTSIHVSPSSLLNNTATAVYPAGRWSIKHNPDYFSNSNGESSCSGYYMENLKTDFSKTGKYDIYFADKLIKTIYSHRRPVANFKIAKSGNSVSLVSTSYDMDKQDDIGLGKGIAKEEWSYKEVNDSSWTSGKLTNAATGKTYIIQLRVQDKQGAWSLPVTKYISGDTATVLQPEANFDFAQDTISLYQPLVITDNSYDPNGLTLSTYRWTVKKDGKNLVTNATSPITNFRNYGAGNYEYNLVVVNSSGKVSEMYTKQIKVTDDASGPKIETNITESGWSEKVDISLQFSDTESGFKGYQYAWSESSNTPTKGWSAMNSSASTTISNDEDGIWYLHVKAYDNKGNETYKILGQYRIDKTAPVVSHTLSTNNNTNKPVVISLQNQDVSGIKEIIAPDGKKHTQNLDSFSYEVVNNGEYTFIVKDVLGHNTIHVVTVSNIDKTKPVVSGLTTHNKKDQIEVSWNANDVTASSVYSGIAGYIYSVDDNALGNPLTSLQKQKSMRVLNAVSLVPSDTKNYLNDIMTVENSVILDSSSAGKYFHVVAIDGAGNASAIRTAKIGKYAVNKLINSTSSDFVKNTVGEDETQGQQYTEFEGPTIEDTTYETSSDVEVYATRTSTFSVKLPKIIVLDGQSGEGKYRARVKGDIAGSQEISITSDDEFSMSEQNATMDKKRDIVASNKQSRSTWDQTAIKNDYSDENAMIGTVTANLTAGSWMGTFDFKIGLTYNPD